MNKSWKKLLSVTNGRPFTITEAYLPQEQIAIRGEFDLPPLAGLSEDEQYFIAAFIKTHGSIKQMESIFSISYPTVKNRLNAIASKLEFIDVKVEVSSPVSSLLDRIDSGELSVTDALKEIP